MMSWQRKLIIFIKRMPNTAIPRKKALDKKLVDWLKVLEWFFDYISKIRRFKMNLRDELVFH
jgi:hypothetical protein